MTGEARNDAAGAMLIGRVGAGDREALAALFELEAGRLLSVAGHIVDDGLLAETAVEDGFVTIWEKAPDYRPDHGSARGWLTAIIASHALDLMKGDADRELHEPAPESMWQAIGARIADTPQIPAGFAMPDPDRKGFLGIRRPAISMFGGFRGTMLAVCLFAAIGVGYMIGQTTVLAPDPVAVAVLVDEDDRPGAFLEAYGDDSIRVVALRDFDLPEGMVLEVWTIYDEGVGPVSLGTLGETADLRLFGPAQPTPQAGQLYEITLEDSPGSVAGEPRGMTMAAGIAVEP